MAMTTRLLETGFDTKFHALQIIFVRMIVTASIGSFYLWRKKVPHFPLGPPGVRWLLGIRGLAGTIGLFGLYCKSFCPDLRCTIANAYDYRLPFIPGHRRCNCHHVPRSDTDWLRLLGRLTSKSCLFCVPIE